MQNNNKESWQLDIRKFSNFPIFKKRFLAKIPKECFLKENEDACWNWQGPMHNQGYGQLAWDGTQYKAHRLSYIIFKGLIPQDKLIRHKCHNKSCVNPKHLIPGTYSDNFIDAVKADLHGSQKLNEECVKVIKWMLKYRPKRGLASKLARLHNVNHKTISNIKKGFSWHWITV